MKRHGLVVCLLLALAASGCVGLLGGDVDPAAVDTQVEDRLESIDSLRMTVLQTVNAENSSTTRLEVTYERPDRVRVVFESGSMAGARIVSNGSATWLYDPTENVVRVVDEPYLDGIEELFPGASRLRTNATFEGNETLAGEDAVELSYAVADTEVSLLLAGGERTSQLSQSAGSSRARFRVWLDTDTWLPRKTRIAFPMFRTNRTVTLRYRNVTVNSGVEADAFTFDVPAEAERKAADRSAFRPPENASVYESPPAAREASPVPVPEPSVPSRFGFADAWVFDHGDHNLTGVELTYEDGRDRIEVVVLEPRPPFFDAGENVTIDGRAALLVTHPEGRIVEWECAGTLRLVAAPPDFDREELLSIAESVGCPG